ncbi:MAG: hypothetical protein II561_01985 [Thermoguttaceae bacterium]|nr:hypothetical protein [Thermoguttaceae bacterium]MBQ3821420.1 hypothetical protein [Thermoguttaceae bacterium]
MTRTRLLFAAAILAALPSLFAAPAAFAIEPSEAKVVTVPGDKPFDFGAEPVRYIENDRVKLGLNLALGGAVTYLEDKANQSGNMINSHDWGRQIQLSYYSGPRPFIGPNGEKPSEDWAALGWNPIQSGDCAGYRSQVLDFERPDGKTIFLRTRPMLWPHSGVPAECLFECKYTLVDNGFTLEATIVNNRSDKTFYGVCDQETPAMYVNAPWYKLVTYLGDKPYENGPVAVLVDKGDGRGWPCTSYYCPEHWSALLNEKNFGIGVYQPTSAFMTGGFAFQESDKGLPLGEKDGPTGYIAPVENTILDWNIKRTYRATFIVGSIEEIRSTVYEIAKKEIPARPSWIFESDRQNWSYVDATDAGFPIVGELAINLNPNANGVAQSPTTFWKAEDAPTLAVEAAFSGDGPDAPTDGEITLTLTPVSPFDQIDSIRRQVKADARKSDPSVEDYPLLPEITKSVPVKFDGISRKLTVDLTELEGYSGAFKRLSVVLPQRAGTARIKRVEFLEK